MRKLFIFFLAISALMGQSLNFAKERNSFDDLGKEKLNIERLLEIFEEKKVISKLEDENWEFFEIEWFDERIPLTLDFLSKKEQPIEKIVYFLPGSGMNFRSNFFTPRKDNLAIFFLEKGYLVIGITPREDKVPYLFGRCYFMKDWGLEKHKNDIRKVISLIEKKTNVSYEILGFSAGAFYSLDYASTFYQDYLLKRIIVLDAVGEYDLSKEKELREKAEITEKAIRNLIEKDKIYIDNSLALLKILIVIESIFPYRNSGVERINYSGDFTFEGLLYFTAIHTNQLEGPTTKYTKLPENWYFEKGWCAGEYIFKEDPKKDIYFLEHTKEKTLKLAAFKTNSGIYPYRTLLDIFSVLAGGKNYSICYENIKCEILWINSEFGMGNHTYVIEKIRNYGGKVKFFLIENYGHADLIYGNNAKEDVWSYIFN